LSAPLKKKKKKNFTKKLWEDQRAQDVSGV
jgi:hypothetical protein